MKKKEERRSNKQKGKPKSNGQPPRKWLPDPGSQRNYGNRTSDASDDSTKLGYVGAQALEENFNKILSDLNGFITNQKGYALTPISVSANSPKISDIIQQITSYAASNILSKSFPNADQALYNSAMRSVGADLDNAIEGAKQLIEYLARVRAHVLALVELST
jgi:hypothetical protein